MLKDFSLSLQLIKEPIRCEIGQVCVQWGMLEAMIEAVIWRAAKVQNDIGRTLTSQIQMQSKIDLLLALLNQNHPKLAPHFEKVARYIRECLIGKRNVIIHGMWWHGATENPEAASTVKFSASGRLTYKGQDFTVAELRAFSLNIAEVTDWITGELSEKLPPLLLRPGGLGHHTPDPQNALDCASRKALALQPIPSQE